MSHAMVAKDAKEKFVGRLGDGLFVGGGVDIFWGKNEAWLQCVRTAGAGDITSQPANPLFPFPDRLSSVFTALGETANS